MARSENGGDKDFVLSSDYQGENVMESQGVSYHESGGDASGSHAFKHIYIAIGGFMILIVLCIVLIARTYSLAEKAQLLALESRLEQLEGRLVSMQDDSVLSQTGGSGNQLILLTERLDQLEANMTARMNNLAKELSTPTPDTTSTAVQKAETPKQLPVETKETKAKMHTVKQGDTLYRISRRYNLSVDQLREYNKLDAKAAIYPGQQLKVTPPK